MADKNFIETIKSLPDDLLAAIQYIFDKIFNNQPATPEKQDTPITTEKIGEAPGEAETNENSENKETPNIQQNVEAKSYTINTLPDINISVTFPPFKKDEILIPYDNSYGSASIKDDSTTVQEYVQLFLNSNKILQTYPVGSIVFSLFPLSDGDIDIFDYHGYKLVPLGNTTTTTISSQFTKQLKDAYNFGSDALVIVAPSMRNKTLYFDTTVSDSQYTNPDMQKNETIGKDTSVQLTPSLQSSGAQFISPERNTAAQQSSTVANPRFIDQALLTDNTVNVDVRDKSIIVYFYLIIEIL